MGLEVVATAIAAVASGAYQANRSREAAKQQRKSADAQKEANAQQSAQEEYERRQAIKQSMRQERIRQAKIESAAEASGVSGSSMEMGTVGSGLTLGAANQAFQAGKSNTNRNISALNQKAADYSSSAAFDLAQGQMGSAIGKMAINAFSMGGGGTQPTAPFTNGGGRGL